MVMVFGVTRIYFIMVFGVTRIYIYYGVWCNKDIFIMVFSVTARGTVDLC